MKTHIWLLLVGLFSCFVVCGEDSSDKTRSLRAPKTNCLSQEFLAQDSGGVFAGILVEISPPRQYRSWRTISLLDEGGDTISFRVEPSEIQSFDETILQKANCVTVEFVTEIIVEDGIELNRVYHVSKLIGS